MASTSPNGPADRHLRLAGTRNLRDIGGYPARDGRRTRWRTLYRADALDRLPPASTDTLIGLGLRQAIDLRWPDETEAWPSVFRRSPAVRYRNVPLRDANPSPNRGLRAVYREIIDGRGAQLAAVAGALAEPDGLPAVIGCAAGVDRTGLAIAVILSAIGVADEVIVTDYVMSAACFAADDHGSGLDDWRKGAITLDCHPEYMADTLDHLAGRYGGAGAYLTAHGVAASAVEALREKLTETVAEPEPAQDSAGNQ
jgi:protein-tyrosine phosphatase